ncbi:MAG: response regulator [Alphaproteobacteria bacterium]
MGRILVVDDSEMSRTVLESRVRKLGHEAETAESGLEALVKISSGGFDVILLDVVMEDMDGHAVLTALSRQGKLDGLPVIVVSGVEDEAERSRCLEAGAREFLKKSVELNRLDKILADLIGDPHGQIETSVDAVAPDTDDTVPEVDFNRLKAAGRKSPLERAWAFEREAPLLFGRVRDHLKAGRMGLAVESCRELSTEAEGVGLMQVVEGCGDTVAALQSGAIGNQLERLSDLIERGRALLKSHKSEL